MKHNISVIIPTLNASIYINKLITTLLNQSVPPNEIIILDSSSSDNTIELCKKYAAVKTYIIARNDFDHGGSRNFAAQNCSGDYLLFLTQDALPADKYYIENILRPFIDKDVAMVSGCQIPHSNIRTSEKLTRHFNYPEKSYVRDKNDIKRLGIKTFFASDVCAAYDKKIFDKLGGFESPILINEDMIIAAKYIFAGYKISYAADAKVVHSHNYNFRQQFVRNFDIGVSLKQYEHYFINVSVTGEGVKMVKYVLKNLMQNHQYKDVLYYILESFFKLCGNKLGKNYRHLPLFVIKHCSMNKNFWEK